MELINNHYEVQGIRLDDLIKKYNAPLYIYDAGKMQSQYQKMKNAFADTSMKINYACKALTNINVLKFFKNIGAGLDTVSLQEVTFGLKAGFAPEDIIYTPNCVGFDEYKEAVELGVKINIDNLSILDQFGHHYGDRIPVCIRINPHIMAGGNKNISTGHIDSKFGISIHQLPHVQRIIDVYGMKVEGLHMHTGSDILDADVFLQGAEILLQIAKEFKDLAYIDFGSGFKVPYKADDIYTDIDDFGKKLSKRFNEFTREYGKELELMFEPGKYLVSEAGYFLVKVNVVKHTTSTVFLGVDSGMNHLVRPMLYDSYHQIINISRPANQPRVYTVVGYICETDTFGWNRRIAEISEGDYLAFKNAGAYCFMMASNYNSRFRPPEVMIYQGKDYLIRKRENMEDLLKNQTEIDFPR